MSDPVPLQPPRSQSEGPEPGATLPGETIDGTIDARDHRRRGRTGLTAFPLLVLTLSWAAVTVWRSPCVQAIGRRSSHPEVWVCRWGPRDAMSIIYSVAEALNTVHGSYPPSIRSMVNANDGDGFHAIASLEAVPRDPWGHDYHYEVVNDRPRITCFGSDGKPGGAEEAADIVYPDPAEEGGAR